MKAKRSNDFQYLGCERGKGGLQPNDNPVAKVFRSQLTIVSCVSGLPMSSEKWALMLAQGEVDEDPRLGRG